MHVSKARVLLLAIVVAAVVFTPATAGGQDPPQQIVTTPVIETPPNPCPEHKSQSTHARHARYVFHRKRISAHNRRTLKHMRRCAFSDKARRNMRRVEHRELRARRDRQTENRLTPYGKWAIPSYIVMCESHGSWTAYNSSGARGPYQFLGWRVPWPVHTQSDRNAHHRMAAKLWHGGAGAAHWVCA